MSDLHDKTARCVLVGPEGFLLVQHSNCSPANRGQWGLPGGRLEVGESARATLGRELMEELKVRIGREQFREVGRYCSKERWHRVFAAEFAGSILGWDRSEIAAVRWHSLAEVNQLEQDGKLHNGFEAKAIRAHLAANPAESRNTAEMGGSPPEDSTDPGSTQTGTPWLERKVL